jgi:hypothetical protein
MQEFRNTPPGSPSFLGQAFFGIQDRPLFARAVNSLIGCLAPNWRRGVFAGDNLITFGKNLSFLTDRPFMEAVARHAGTDIERSILWRTAVLCWAARNGLRREGDFVECGCYRGTSARILADALGFGGLDRTYWLYDLFEYPEAAPTPRCPAWGRTSTRRRAGASPTCPMSG